jgi:hypothetical protein
MKKKNYEYDTLLYFLGNLNMGPINYSFTLHWAGKAQEGQIHWLIEFHCMLQRKWSVVNTTQ